jgi:hypothetical protein
MPSAEGAVQSVSQPGGPGGGWTGVKHPSEPVRRGIVVHRSISLDWLHRHPTWQMKFRLEEIR